MVNMVTIMLIILMSIGKNRMIRRGRRRRRATKKQALQEEKLW
jgi:hypothetical protein